MMDRGSVFNNILGEVRQSAPEQSTFATVDAGLVMPPEDQPRKHFDPESLQSLAESIKEHGILQPLTVRSTGAGIYEVVAGERRLKASQIAGLQKLPVVIRDEESRESLYLLSLAENLQREDLNVIEETEGILAALQLALELDRDEVTSLLYRMEHLEKDAEKSLGSIGGGDDSESPNSLEAYKASAHNVMGNEDLVYVDAQGSQEMIVRSLFAELGTMGVRSFLSNRLPLLNMPDNILSAVRESSLAYTKARAIARVEDEARRGALVRETLETPLSVSEVNRRVAEENSRGAPARNVKEEETPTRRIQDRTTRIARVIKKSPDLDEDKARKADELLDELEALFSE